LPKRGWYWYRNEYNPHSAAGMGPPAARPPRSNFPLTKTTLKSADGNGRCAKIIVTVVGQRGQGIEQFAAGDAERLHPAPGEFPNRPGDRVRSKSSDIAIRDGEAAMEFRFLLFRQNRDSRHVARTQRCNDYDSIHSAKPEVCCGQTPPVKPRPYVRFTGSIEAVSTTPANSVFGVK